MAGDLVLAREEAIGLIYEASHNPDTWLELIDLIRKVCDARTASIAVTCTDSIRPQMRIQKGITPDVERSIREHYYKFDVWSKRLYNLFPEGTIYTGDQIWDRKELLKSVMYNECIVQLEVDNTLGGYFKIDEHAALRIGAMFHSEKSTIGTHHINWLTSLMPHFKRAISMQKFYGNKRLLDNRFPAAILSDSGQLIMANDLFEEFASSVGIFSTKNNKLQFRDAHTQRVLAEYLESIRIGFSIDTPNCVISAEPKNGSFPVNIELSLTRMTKNNHESNFQNYVLLRVPYNSPINNQVNCRQLKLTNTEKEIFEYLAEGRSPKEIAALRNRSEHTIRTHMKAIYKKANVTSQSQLASLYFRMKH